MSAEPGMVEGEAAAAPATRRADDFAKLLVVVGTALAALPFVALLAATIAASLQAGGPRANLMLPVELFPATVMGGILLVWASWPRGARRWSVVAPLGLAVAAFTVAIVVVSVTGRATVALDREGWDVGLVVAALAVTVLASAALVVSGALLVAAAFSRGAR